MMFTQISDTYKVEFCSKAQLPETNDTLNLNSVSLQMEN